MLGGGGGCNAKARELGKVELGSANIYVLRTDVKNAYSVFP